MKFCFVLPTSSLQVAGGYKIVYEYANRLTKLGHEVVILYLNSRRLKRYQFPKLVRRTIMDTIMLIEPRWFPLDNRVKKVSDFSNHDVAEEIESCDVVIATAISTTEFVKNVSSEVQRGYLIQGFENWGISDEEVYATYNYGFKNFVVSNWLKKIVDLHSGTESILLSNALDTTFYRETRPYCERSKYSIGVLYHPSKCKGFEYALHAIEKIKGIYPELVVRVFGSYNRPSILPQWVSYKQKLTQDETVKFYNDIRVYMCASVDEGFGLTGFEAMACGCVLVTSDFQGAKEYAVDGNNALVSVRCDVDAMVNNVCRVFENDNLALKLIENGKKTVASTSWEDNLNRFVEAFK